MPVDTKRAAGWPIEKELCESEREREGEKGSLPSARVNGSASIVLRLDRRRGRRRQMGRGGGAFTLCVLFIETISSALFYTKLIGRDEREREIERVRGSNGARAARQMGERPSPDSVRRARNSAAVYCALIGRWPRPRTYGDQRMMIERERERDRRFVSRGRFPLTDASQHH